MKGKLKSIVLIGSLLVLTTPVYGEPVLITDIDVSVSTASVGDSYSVEISGLLPDRVHVLTAVPLVRRDENTFEIDLMVERSALRSVFEEDLLVSAVVVPFTRSAYLGALEEGNYSAKVNYFLGGALSESQDHIFSTQLPTLVATHAPLPPAIWLLAGGLCSLIMLKRRPG